MCQLPQQKQDSMMRVRAECSGFQAHHQGEELYSVLRASACTDEN